MIEVMVTGAFGRMDRRPVAPEVAHFADVACAVNDSLDCTSLPVFGNRTRVFAGLS